MPEIRISSWNVKNVENMSSMFAHTKKFQANISNWNVSNVTSTSCMFMNSQFKTDIYKWNVSEHVRNMGDMFAYSPIPKEHLPKGVVSISYFGA